MNTDEPGPKDAAEQPGSPVRSIGPEHINPADPGLSAVPGAERRNYALPISIVAGLLLIAALWAIFAPHGAQPPILTFRSDDLGCSFEYPSELRKGPNYLRSDGGSLLTIERHDLYMAKKDWVAGLPDILFEQVLIQLNENYTELVEKSRTHFVMGGSKAVRVALTGRAQSAKQEFAITIVIAATPDWVYVLRSYFPMSRAEKEQPLFERVYTTWKFLDEGAPAADGTANSTEAPR
jgi:hypothetical protein